MVIETLHEYLVLVEHMSFTAAAGQLNLTQSALSKHISALEQELGVKLIDRSGSHIGLTAQGRAFCEEAFRITDAYEHAKARMLAMEEPVRIGGSVYDSAVLALVASARHTLSEGGLDVELNTLNVAHQELKGALDGGSLDICVDIALEGEDTYLPNVKHALLTTVPFIVIVKSGHHLAQHEALSIDDLREYRIMHPTGSVASARGAMVVEKLFCKHDIKMRKRIFFANDARDFPFADLGEDVFVMPRSLFNKQTFGQRLGQYKTMPLTDGDAFFPYRMVWRASEERPAVLACVQALLEAGQAMDESKRPEAE